MTALAALAASMMLTEDDAVRRALEHDPNLATLRASVRAAEAAPRGVGLWPNPQLRVGVTDLAAEIGDPASARNNVGLAWQPPRAAALRAEAALVGAREAEAKSAMETARARTAAEVRLLHRTLALLGEQLRVARRAVEARQEIVAAVKEQIEAGVKTLPARHAAEMALAEAQVNVEQLEHQRKLQAVRLARRVNLDAATLEVSPGAGLLEFQPRLLDREALRKQAQAHRPEPGAIDTRCRAAAFDVKAARQELYPWFSSVQFFRRTARLDAPGTWGFQVGVEIPVFRWKENRVGTAKATLEECRAKLAATGASIGAEVDELVTRLEATAEALRDGRPALHAAQADEVELMRASGRADKVAPLEARVRGLDARRVWLDRLLEYRVLEAGLRQALGEVN